MKQLIAAIIIIGLVGYGVYDQMIKKNHSTAQESTSQSSQSVSSNSNKTTSTNNAGKTNENKTVGVEKGDIAPDFKLKTFDNKSIKLSDYRGKKVLLNFWASWCPPCNAEAPNLEAYYKKHKSNHFEMLSVNLTPAEKSVSNAKDFVNKYHFTFPVVLDTTGSVANTYQASSIPTTYIIDSNGIIQQKVVGPMSENMIDNILATIK